MSRNTVPIPEPDRALFRRCRVLNEDIALLRKSLPEPEVVAALERISPDKLPEDQQRMQACILRDKADLKAKEAELEESVIRAELATQRIPNANLRRIVRLYCLDGLSYAETKHSVSCCQRTVERWIAYLNVEGNADAAANQGGTERR